MFVLKMFNLFKALQKMDMNFIVVLYKIYCLIAKLFLKYSPL